jgi:soluble lytic murein transglycosylase
MLSQSGPNGLHPVRDVRVKQAPPSINRRHFVRGLFASAAAIAMPGIAAPAFAAGPTAVAAVRAAVSGDFLGGGSLAANSGDQAAIKLVELLYLRDHGKDVGFQRIRDFQAAAPKWPLTDTLNKRAEQALFAHVENPSLVIDYFNTRKPNAAEGHAALARAYFASGDTDAARAALRRAWADTSMDSSTEASILSEFKGQLSPSDHKKRLDQLLFAQQPGAAMRQARRMGGSALAIAQAGENILRGNDHAYTSLPAALRAESCLRYLVARCYRKQEKWEKSRNILLQMGAKDGDAAAIWEERRTIARHSIGPNHPGTWDEAYKLVSRHGLTKGIELVDAEFMSGWIALRYLRDPGTALAHFSRVRNAAESRTELARADYWTGRAQLALGDKPAATQAFRSAAKLTTVYYGQLAREQLGLGNKPEEITPGAASAAAQASVEKDEVVRAMLLMHQASGSSSLPMFLWSLANRFNSVDEMNAVAAITHRLGGTFLSLKLAKAAGQADIDIDSWSYPTKGLPAWRSIGKPIERAMVFALSRQESEFNPNAGSRVGAQGLMQLMPGTARLVAKQYRLPYKPASLKDPNYNVQLGAAHLADLVSDFGGSYVLTLVAYNAGPRRAREWTAEFGDIRGGTVDPIDWVESIPFNETRQYVQKVLQNLHVYRSRLAPETVRSMTADLKRGTPSELATSSTAPVAEQNCSGITSLLKGCN